MTKPRLGVNIDHVATRPEQPRVRIPPVLFVAMVFLFSCLTVLTVESVREYAFGAQAMPLGRVGDSIETYLPAAFTLVGMWVAGFWRKEASWQTRALLLAGCVLAIVSAKILTTMLLISTCFLFISSPNCL